MRVSEHNEQTDSERREVTDLVASVKIRYVWSYSSMNPSRAREKAYRRHNLSRHPPGERTRWRLNTALHKRVVYKTMRNNDDSVHTYGGGLQMPADNRELPSVYMGGTMRESMEDHLSDDDKNQLFFPAKVS
jgi:hypothetical protein